MKLIYLKLALKSDSYDLSIGTKIPFFRVSTTIEPGRYRERFDYLYTVHPSDKKYGQTSHYFFSRSEVFPKLIFVRNFQYECPLYESD